MEESKNKEEFEVKCPIHKEEHQATLDCSYCGSSNTKIVLIIGKCEDCGYLETAHIKDYEDVWESEDGS